MTHYAPVPCDLLTVGSPGRTSQGAWLDLLTFLKHAAWFEAAVVSQNNFVIPRGGEG